MTEKNEVAESLDLSRSEAGQRMQDKNKKNRGGNLVPWRGGVAKAETRLKIKITRISSSYDYLGTTSVFHGAVCCGTACYWLYCHY